MQTIRIFQPYGAHLRFDGVTNLQVSPGGLIRFNFEPKDEKGGAKEDTQALAIFNINVISGYSVEEPIERITKVEGIVVP